MIRMIRDFYDFVINSDEKDYRSLKRKGIILKAFLIDRSGKYDIVGKIDKFGVFQIVLIYKNKVVPYEEKFLNFKRVKLWKVLQIEDLIDEYVYYHDSSNLNSLEGKLVCYNREVVNNEDLKKLKKIADLYLHQ